MDHREQIADVLSQLGIPQGEAYEASAIAGMAAGEAGRTPTLYREVKAIVKRHVLSHLGEIDLAHPTIQGESKKIHRFGKLALVELKPTLYSFTHNRYGIAEGTDNERLDFWGLFSDVLNEDKALETPGQYPFLNNYLGEISVGTKRYAIVHFLDEIPPLEVVWKRYLVGTMKHTLKEVDRRRTRDGQVISYEGAFPADFVRFDWRNPLPDKDECIPDEFAELYIDTARARATAKEVSRKINAFLKAHGYELVDICYFMDYAGSSVCSEITPDGMRIRKKEESYDKDLWRMGKDKSVVFDTWKKLYEDLSA